MTPRERVLSGAFSGERLRATYPAVTSDSALVVGEGSHDQLSLVEVLNPFGLALAEGENLNDAFAADPEQGEARLAEFAGKTRTAIQNGVAKADGIWYRLVGAEMALCTPMQYGGYYLELDRELLQSAEGAKFNVVAVVGAEETFLDVVADLPAQGLAWDAAGTGVAAPELRAMTGKCLIADDPNADILLSLTSPGALATPQKEPVHV